MRYASAASSDGLIDIAPIQMEVTQIQRDIPNAVAVLMQIIDLPSSFQIFECLLRQLLIPETQRFA